MKFETIHFKNILLYPGDCMEVLKRLPDNIVHSVVTDPPYHLASIVKRFGGANAAPAQFGTDGAYARASKGFMGKEWDGGDIAFSVPLWSEVLRVLKPGGHVVSFAASKNYHRMAVAIEDAGFEIRDQIMWLYGTGFPKSHNVGKVHPEWDGWGTALKPAHEPICLARKPLSEKTVAANVKRWGTGAINIESSRTDEGRFPANVVHDGSDEVQDAFPDSKSCDTPSNAKPSGKIFGGSRSQGAIYPGERGSAARFFYSAKASKEDRAGSSHPTVKPVKLIEWLVTMVTPPGGVVLDMFAGTGTTGQAAINCNCRAALIEREEEYINDIRRRFGGEE